ncbi:MAG: hypothetical protein IAE85_15685 [Anaerolinea sp.]|nr:hypothetical protein [Anaerolinea sp.]
MAPLEGVFAACVAQLNSGTPVEACLALHPGEAAELSPLLRIVVALRALAAPAPAMSPAAAQEARARFVTRAGALSQPTLISSEEALAQASEVLAGGAAAEACLDAFPHHAAELRPGLEILAALQQASAPAPERDLAERAEARARFMAQAQAKALSRPPQIAIEEALDASLAAVAAGQPAEACLLAYPHYADELRPALAVVAALQTELAQPAPARPEPARRTQRQAFVAAAQAGRRQMRAQQAGASWRELWQGLFRQPAWARVAVLLLMAVLLVGFGRVAITTAAAALPGDVLYPVKLATEQVRLLVTSDEAQRAALRQQFEQSRRAETAAVVEQHRQVEVQFSGAIESMVDGVWRIAGLETPVIVPGDAVVRGQPAVGAHVVILAYSDGHGNLVARQALIVDASSAPLPSATPTFSRPPRVEPPAVAPLPPGPLATATWTPGVRLTPTWTAVLTGTRTLTATPTPTTTATGTTTPSGTPTVSATPTATPGPVPVSLYGTIQEMNASWWLVSGRTVRIDGQTVIDQSQGPAQVGADVAVTGMQQPDGSVLALVIRVQPAQETDYFTDVIQSMSGSQWLIGNRLVTVTSATQIVGTAEVGRTARVWLARPAGGAWAATRIEVEDPTAEPYYIEGVISAFSASSWVIDGQTVRVTGQTVITGVAPQVGYVAEAMVVSTGSSLTATWINVLAPTTAATATPTATPPAATPTWTPTPPPTATPTATPPAATPTWTPTPPPTATPTATLPAATPTPSDTPEPPTATPEPPTASPTPSNTAEPATATPEATAGLTVLISSGAAFHTWGCWRG